MNLNPLAFLSEAVKHVEFDFDGTRVESPIILVFPVDEGTKKFKEGSHHIVTKIQSKCGVESCKIYYSSTKEEIFLEFAPKMREIRTKAAIDNFKLELNPDTLQKISENGIPDQQIGPFTIGDNHRIVPYHPFEFIYGKFKDGEENMKLYRNRHHKDDHPFTNAIQVKLSLALLENKHIEGGLNLDLENSIEKGNLLSFFPMHHKDLCDEIAKQWYQKGRSAPWKKPYHAMRDYLGEKVGLYFRFLGHYTTYLISSAAVGVIMQIVVFSTEDWSSPAVPFYSFFVILWAVFMLEHWQRLQKTCAMRWGMIGFEEFEADRPQYHGDTISSLINGKPVIHFSRTKALLKMYYSAAVISSLILLVIGTTASVYVARNAMAVNSSTRDNAATVASIINAIQIAVFNYVYSKVSKRLTDMENHRTNTEYEDSTIAKLFAFQFVNSYASFFFIAFCAKFLPRLSGEDENNSGQCGEQDCMHALGVNLGIVLMTRITVGNFQEFVLPSIINYFTRKLNNSKATSEAEKEFRKPNYDFIQDSIDDWSELLIQFGYQTLFITALPLASLLSLINNHFELRGDASKMLFETRRVAPRSAEDIGTWASVFDLMTTLAVPTNAAMLTFTMTIFDEKSLPLRFWLFIGFQWFVFTVQGILRMTIPDTPYDAEIQIARGNFIVSKVIDFEPDDNDDEKASLFSSLVKIEDVKIRDDFAEK